MKKWIGLFLCFAVLFVLAACGDKGSSGRNGKQPAGVDADAPLPEPINEPEIAEGSREGIEFALTDDYTYPDDYPEEGGNICVVGIFDTYQEGDNTYCTLRNAKIEDSAHISEDKA